MRSFFLKIFFIPYCFIYKKWKIKKYQIGPSALLVLQLVLFFQIRTYAQEFDTTVTKEEFSKKQIIVPATLILSGFVTNMNKPLSIKHYFRQERNEHIPHFSTTIDNYLQFAPIAVAYGLDAIGIKSRNNITNRSIILLKGELLAFSTTSILKRAFHNLRPDGSSHTSFPSGHTTQAFAAATFLSEEYKIKYPWMPYPAF